MTRALPLMWFAVFGMMAAAAGQHVLEGEYPMAVFDAALASLAVVMFVIGGRR